MLTKYNLSGQFTTGFRKDVAGQLDVYLGEHELIIRPAQQGLSSERLHITPFLGSMLFGTSYMEGCEIVERGYELSVSGTNVGIYTNGGGRDGEFEEFKVKDAQIHGAFSPAGLSIHIIANTLAGDDVCYSARERRKNAYKPIVVRVEFIVPPQELSRFLALRVPLNSEAFARFNWPLE